MTIEDVAAAAGVSVATVSRALRNLPNVAPSTRERVQAVADSLNYVANAAAANLAVGRTTSSTAASTGTVAAVVPVLDSWYFAKAVAGTEAVLKESNFDLLLYAMTNESERQEFVSGRTDWMRRSDGLIMFDLRLSDSEALRMQANGAKIVTIGTTTPCFPSLMLDEITATRAAVDHLVSKGHRRIGVITGDEKDLGFRVPILRLEGFRQGLEAVGIERDAELEVPGGFSTEGGREAMAELLKLDDPPTAVFAMSDEMAFGALQLMRQQGLRAPDDIAVVGFDDNDLADLFELTTVRQDVDQIGATAARMILASIQGGGTPNDGAPDRVLRETTLVIRSSA